MKKVHIFGGGTISHVRPHLALCAPAYGSTAGILKTFCSRRLEKLDTKVHLTRMAGGSPEESLNYGYMETNEDVEKVLESLINSPDTKIIFMSCALCDFDGIIDYKLTFNESEHGKYGERLDSKKDYQIRISPAEKLISKIRQSRKDIFLVGFKTTCNESEDSQYLKGLNLLKSSSCNLVLCNDVGTRLNMVITPEEARYHVTTDRLSALQGLVDMTYLRSHLTFTRSTVVAGEPIKWDSKLVPSTLRDVVNYCVKRGAYKPFRGATVGHFACKVDDNTFLTSIRKSNFNDIDKNGLVLVKTDGPDSVIAYGAKPSVGGQSQRIVFSEHLDYDCIVHFHCPKKEGSLVPTISQREYECGSHECGRNTSIGLTKFGNLSAVYLDEHGPNIVFNRGINPQEVISFIEANFNLEEKTGGYVSLGQILNQNDSLEDLKSIS